MAYPYPTVGPIPPFTNLPINAQYYEPSVFNISAITRGQQTTVTTSVDHNFIVGQEVRLHIPPSFGIRQLNEKTAFVISIPLATQVVLDIASALMDAYVASSASTTAQIAAIANINSGQINSSGPASTLNYIPGSFRNISPL